MQKSGHCCLPHWGVGRATSRNCTESFKNYRVSVGAGWEEGLKERRAWLGLVEGEDRTPFL